MIFLVAIYGYIYGFLLVIDSSTKKYPGTQLTEVL